MKLWDVEPKEVCFRYGRNRAGKKEQGNPVIIGNECLLLSFHAAALLSFFSINSGRSRNSVRMKS